MAEFKRQEGIAMILAIVAVFLLSVAVLATRSGVDLASGIAASAAHETQAGYLARSGLAMVSAALAEDDTAVDSFNDDWAAANDMGAVPIADVGWAVGKVTDEEGKLNVLDLVNKDRMSDELTELAEIRLLDLLMIIGLTESRADEIVDSLVDWMDEDSTVTGFGAEDSYYGSLVPEYSCPDTYLMTVDELALVKGIGPILLYQGEGEVPPLLRFVTVYGDKAGDYRKVNINTAPVEVLMALAPEIDRQLAEEIVASRDTEPFTSPAQIKDVPGFPGDQFYSETLASLVDVSSSHFSARITGETPSASSQAFGVFRRTGQAVKLVYYKSF
ncbi:MAG: type II secretion system minor pseudopilin GspK [bacterium]|nr:type II secretion system minor pseudopilin GspK [bacterium]